MVHLIWSIRGTCLVAASLAGLLLCLVNSARSCPNDLAGSARACFATYKVKLKSMQHSPQKLCCGLDVEIFRAFCKSYIDGSRCVRSLRNQCPPEKQRMIDSALVSLDGARDGLNDLCLDDNIVEKYARYQSCFYRSGPDSEYCFAVHLLGNGNGENTIRFLETVGATSKAEFCRKMTKTVTCVQKNVRRQCGEHAATLAALLTKPMVKHSTECDYTVDVGRPQQGPRQPYQSNPAYISDDGSGTNNKNNNRGGSGDGSRTSTANKRRGSGKRNVAPTLRPSITAVAFFVSLLLPLHLTTWFSFEYIAG